MLSNILHVRCMHIDILWLQLGFPGNGIVTILVHCNIDFRPQNIPAGILILAIQTSLLHRMSLSLIVHLAHMYLSIKRRTAL